MCSHNCRVNFGKVYAAYSYAISKFSYNTSTILIHVFDKCISDKNVFNTHSDYIFLKIILYLFKPCYLSPCAGLLRTPNKHKSRQPLPSANLSNKHETLLSRHRITLLSGHIGTLLSWNIVAQLLLNCLTDFSFYWNTVLFWYLLTLLGWNLGTHVLLNWLANFSRL